MSAKWMFRKQMMIGFLLMIYIFVLFIPVEQAACEEKPKGFTKEELAQMLAPIALYPDSLLAQIFMASSYPLEIVEADRFLKKEKGLKDDKLDEALKEKKWDVSVKSLCHYPEVVSSMSEQLDWIKNLGDAVLGQQKEVMDMVQELRAKAKEQGNLKSNEQQKVVEKEKIIVIESPSPTVVYVPSYSPTVVYGPWWYPHYPPYYWHHPPYYYRPVAGVVAFGTGVAVGASINRWAGVNWGRGDIDIDINRTTNFNKNVNINSNKINKQTWQHNSDHRKGVSYKDRSTSQKFGQSGKRSTEMKNKARGYNPQGQNRKRIESKNKQGVNRKSIGSNKGSQRKKYSSGTSSKRKSNSAFSGQNSRKNTNRSSLRGQQSRKKYSGGGGRRR